MVCSRFPGMEALTATRIEERGARPIQLAPRSSILDPQQPLAECNSGTEFPKARRCSGCGRKILSRAATAAGSAP